MTPATNTKKSKSLQIALSLNYLLMAILLLAVAGFISFLNIYGVFLALVTALICFGCFKQNRWAYFSAAAWGLACYQLAKQGYEFENVKRYVMMLGISVIPLALFLHEILTKPAKKHAQNSGNNDSDKKNMPD